MPLTSTHSDIWGAIQRLTGLKADNFAHHTSVTEAVSHVVNGYDWKEGDVVVSFDKEYPSDVLPWMLNEKRYGYTLKMMDKSAVFEPAKFVESLPKNTRMLNMTHVAFNTGDMVNAAELGKLLKERDILFVLDCSQSLGSRAISKEDLENVDIMTAVTYKWLLGSYGHAITYFSDTALQKIERTHANWMASPAGQDTSSLVDYSMDVLGGARKFDPGQAPSMLSSAGLRAALYVIEELGLENIQKHNESLVSQFVKSYPQDKFDLVTRSDFMNSIVCLKLKSGDPDELSEKLTHAKFKSSVREGNLRLGFHLYNTSQEVEKLVEALSS